MKKIYNYSQFNINERGIFTWIKDKVINRLSGWTKDFLTALKQGLVRKIPSGPRKGSPYAMLFVPENGSIVEQLRNYMSMRLTESAVPLESTKFTNVGAPELVDDLRDYFKIKTTMADYYAKPKEERDPKDTARGMKAKPIFIYGAPGIGKTEIVAQVCDELSVPLLFLDVQFMNPEDFKGIPSVHNIRDPKILNGSILDPGEGFTRANPPSVFPRDNGVGNRGGYIFMDELNRANTSVLNTLMQFVQQGRIGDEYKLPSKWVLIAAGNRPEDDPEANIQELGTALSSRFTIVNYVPNYNAAKGHEIDDWKSWAEKEMNIMPELVSYLQSNPDQFHHNDPSPDRGGAFPSPRSWTEASKILLSKMTLNSKKSWRDMPIDYIINVFSKEVGAVAAGQFGSYLKVLSSLSVQELDQILVDSSKVQIPAGLKTNPSHLWGLGSMLYSRIDKGSLNVKNFNQIYNLLKYLHRANKNAEKFAWIYKKALRDFPDLDHLKKIASETPEMTTKKQELAKMAGDIAANISK